MHHDPHHAAPPASPEVVGPPSTWAGWVTRHRWLGFVLPLLVFMLAGQLEQPLAETASSAAVGTADDAKSDPFADDQEADTSAVDRFSESSSSAIDSNTRYPIAYAIRIGLTLAAMLLVLPVYRQFQLRAGWLALLVGALGAPIWIGLSYLQRVYVALPDAVAAWLGGTRAGFDPLTALADRPTLLALFLAVRFFGLVLIVPIIEEFFLRGFLARFVAEADWWKIPIGAVSASSIAAIVGYAVLTHPNEMFAAVVWFLLVTWLVARTQNIWDAVVAHATTNLWLGVWVLTTKQFWLW